MNQPEGRRTTVTLHHADALSYSQLFLPGRDWWSVAPETPDICLVSALAEFFDPTPQCRLWLYRSKCIEPM
jgi:hypothetical protein